MSSTCRGPAPARTSAPSCFAPPSIGALVAYIAATFATGGSALPGYAANDAFYPGTGRYDAIHTCNAWTGDALRHAGVRIGAWTPFPITVMRWF